MNRTFLEWTPRLGAWVLIAGVAARYGWQPALASVLIFALGIAAATLSLPARERLAPRRGTGMQWKDCPSEGRHRGDERLEARSR